ncbi:MAG: PilN domain-containing protein [Nitrospirota bacterium]
MNVAIKKFASFTSASLTKLDGILWKPLWKILTFSPADDAISPKKALLASLEKGRVSVAYGSRFLSRIKIKGLREYSFEEGRYPQPEGLASSLSLAINDFKASGLKVCLSIPKAWAIIKTAEFPLTVKENLSDVVSYELDRLTPFSPEDALYDFKILRETSEKLTILLMVAKADLVKPYIDALREKDIAVNRVTVNLSDIGTLCRYIDNVTDFIFFEMNGDGYEGALFLAGSITDAFAGSFITSPVPPLKSPLSPPFPKGGVGGFEGVEKSKVDTLVTEIAPFIATAKNQGKKSKVIVVSKDKIHASLEEQFKQQINLPVRILNETDLKFTPSWSQEVVPFAAIGGVLESLWPRGHGLNLLKKGYREIHKYPKALTLVLILSIIVMWVFYLIAPLKVEEKRLREIDRQIMLRKEDVRKVETLKKEIEALNDEISTINNFKENNPMALNIIKELTAILPKNTWLTRVRIAESAVNIEGYAASATGLLPKLEASNYFKKAEFASPTFRDARMNADRFNIKVEIEGIKKDKGK